MKNTKQEVKDKIFSFLSEHNRFKKVKDEKETVCVIMVNGRRVELSSGKKLWQSIGAAKAAIKNHIKYFCHFFAGNDFYLYDSLGKPDHTLTKKTTDEAMNEWVEKHVRFVPYEEYVMLKNKGDKK